jgi:hypothetical protein
VLWPADPSGRPKRSTRFDAAWFNGGIFCAQGHPDVEKAPMNEDRFNMEVRKFLKEVGVTSQREIERVVRDRQVKGGVLKLRMTLTAENITFEHVVERSIAVDDDH